MSTTTEDRRIAKTYADCKKTAEDAAGGARAFAIIGPAYRKALVAQAILQFLHQLRPYGVDAATVAATMADLYTRMTDDEDLQ